MQIFLFERVDQVSGNYHPEGGLVVVARDRQHVEELISGDQSIQVTEREWEHVAIYPLIGEAEAKVYVFPDAGCC